MESHDSEYLEQLRMVHTRSRHRKPSHWRFSLRALLLLMTCVCLGFTWLNFNGNEFASQASDYWRFLPQSRASDVITVCSWIAAIIAGLIVTGVVYRLTERKAFRAFMYITCFSFLMLFGALSMKGEPLQERELRKVSGYQWQRSMMIHFSVVLPICSFVGWYGRTLTKESI